MKHARYHDRDYLFGQRMLILRTAIGFTQAALADYLGVSRFAVGAWEVGNSYPKISHLKSFIELALQRGAFAEEQEAEEIRTLWQAARQKVLIDESWLAALFAATSKTRGNMSSTSPSPRVSQTANEGARTSPLQLPLQSAPFFGREVELEQIRALLSDPACRLLTLVGPGGIGKTRLALEVATRHAGDYQDGVVYVDLASVATVNEIVSAISNALNLSLSNPSDSTTQILAYLRERHMLMVLDSFEHLLEHTELLIDILRYSPAITLLVTSRARLNLQVEWLFHVVGLSYPPQEQHLDIKRKPGDLLAYSAIQLFMQCARQVQPDLLLYESTLAAIARICQQVDGMPLAIELAAAGLRTLPIANIEKQIHQNLDVLATTLRDVPARHHSLRAVFNHSWGLLSELEQTLLCRLAVFRGSFTLGAAEQVAGATHELLTELLDKSLLRLANQGTYPNRVANPRFLLLGSVREYALEKLTERDEVGTVQHQHAAYYLKFAEAVSAQWDNPAVDIALEELDQDHDNMRAALQWARDNGHSILGLQLAGSLWRFWRRGGHISEGRVWLEELLALEQENTDARTLTARLSALNGAGWLATDQHDFGRAAYFFEQAKTLRGTLGEIEDDTPLLVNAALHSRAIGEYRHATELLRDAVTRLRALFDERSATKGNMGLALYCLALLLREQGNYTGARALFEEGITFFRELNDREGMAQGQLGLSDLARDHGDIVQTRALSEQSLAIFRKAGLEWAIGFALNNLALAAYLDGDLPQAFTYISESVELFRGIQNQVSLAEVLITLGRIQEAQGNRETARATLAEALKLAWSVGPSLMIAAALEELANLEVQLGQVIQAVRLLNASSAVRVQMGTPVRPVDQIRLDHILATTRAALGKATFAIVWAEASALPLEKFVAPIVGDLQRNQSLPASRAFFRLQSAQEMSKPMLPPPTPEFSAQEPRVDWGDALAVTSFYGRDQELDLLSAWIVGEHCRLVSVLGQGGIGKSALTTKLMRRVAADFEVVIWRSLHDVPTCEALLDSCLQVLAPDTLIDSSASLERRQDLLLECLRNRRVLLVYDNLESFLEEGEASGRMRVGYEGAARVLRRIAETEHQSCLLLTSREKPSNLVPLEGNRAPVRILRLAPLDVEACEALLAEKEVTGSRVDRLRLIEVYGGNPLALKIVAQTIVSLFDGEIASFLEQGELIFGGVQELLNEQFDRLSLLEQCALRWLAILREPAILDEVLALLVAPVSRARLLEAMESLHRRSLIERGHGRGSFTLQSVVLEYMTMRIITEASDEILAGKLAGILVEHGFELAQSHEYIREIQERLLVAPILERLQSVYRQPSALEKYLLTLLKQVAIERTHVQDYVGANLVALLRLLRGNLQELDLSHLVLRNVYLQGIEMQDSSLVGSISRDSIFSEAIDIITAVAVSSTGEYWAASSRLGEIRLWEAGGKSLHLAWRAHANMIWSLAFSPDGRSLASASWDRSVKVWDTTTGLLLWSGSLTSHVNRVAFSPDGRTLASSGNDMAVRLWDARTGNPLQILAHPDAVNSLTWSPDGSLIGTGDVKGTIRLWAVSKTEPAYCRLTLAEHSNCVEGLAFSPNGSILASASWDSTVKLWNVAEGKLWQTLTGHTDRATRIAWSPDGHTLSSISRDQTIRLWDAVQGRYRAVLRGHTSGMSGIAFTPDSNRLVTSSEDGTLRVWDVANGQCTRIIQGHAASLNDVDWSPDGKQLVSCSTDYVVTIYAVDGLTPPKNFRGHTGVVYGVGWSPDGQWLASSEWDHSIRLWNPTSGTNHQHLLFPGDSNSYFYGVAWSPVGQRLAGGTYRRGVLVWDVTMQRQPWAGEEFPTWIRLVAWSPDGRWLAGGGDDGIVYVWDAADGTLLQQLQGHYSMITCLAWCTHGYCLASSSGGKEGGELFVWDTRRGARVASFVQPSETISAVAWGGEEVVISGDGVGALRWWDLQSGQYVWEREAHQGTVQALRRSPDGTKLASCGDDGVIRLWDLHSGEHLQTLRRDRSYERMDITGLSGITAAQRASLMALGAVESST